jgi:nucleotide-binding universal stress UspA family protein
VNDDRVPTGAVVVGTDRSTAGHRALRWATAEARRTGAPLCVLSAAPDRSPAADRSLFADVLAAVESRVPLGRRGHPVPDRLRTLSAEASMVVVPATFAGLAELVAASYSPVVVVPERDAEDGPVLLGAAPWTGEEVFDLAFRGAAQRCVGLVAVRTWTEARVDLGRTRRRTPGPGPPGSVDRATERVRRDLDLALSAWTVIYPTVQVERIVAQDHATALLRELCVRAQLLVLGRSGRGALLGLVVGSPAVDLLGGAQCPLLVVPSAGPPRSTWWPTGFPSRVLPGH